MKKISESIRNKGLLTLSLIILLFFLIRFALIFIGTKLGETRENEQNQIKMNMLMNILSEGNDKRAAADARITGYEAADVELVTNLLKELVTEDGYIGPRVLPDSFVVELRNDRLILPEEYQAYGTDLTREVIEEGLKNGTMSVAVTSASAAGEASPAIDGENAEDPSEDPVFVPGFLTFKKLCEDTVYVSIMPEDEYNSYLDRYSYNIYEALQSADAAFGGISLAVQEQDDELQLTWQIGINETEDVLSALGLTVETIRSRTPVLTLNGQDYACETHEIVSRSTDGDNLLLVQMLPLLSFREQNIRRSLLVDLLMVMIFLTITVYVLSVQHYTAEHELTPAQAAHFKPSKMRSRMVNVGLLSILITFVLALLIESVGQFYVELRYGRDTLQIVSRQLETMNLERQKNDVEEEESWYTYYGEEMASLFTAYPELATREMLQKCCDAVQVDYIMLFDHNGHLTNCSRAYSGFTLTDEQDKELYDFRRLLHGMSGSIVHDTSAEGLTGLERHLIGVGMPDEATGKHGALIMALMPDVAERWYSSFEDDTPLTVASGTYCFAADSATGEILYSSSASMVGKTIREYGLPETSLRDGYMDLTSVLGTDYLVVTSRNGNWVYYFAVKAGTMFEPVLRYGVIIAVLFAVVLALLLVFLLGGYNEKAYQEWTALLAQSKEKDASPLSEKAADKIETSLMQGKEYVTRQQKTILHKISKGLRWDQREPKEKARLVLRIGIVALLLLCLNVLWEKRLTNENYSTLLGFLLHGDWMRGLNLFGLCSTLLIISVAYLINLLSIVILRLSSGLAEKTGQTISRLLFSCIKYITVFVVIYFGLGYLGFPTSTIIASLGAVSLAISLGAQSLISDILAGLAIVFDGSFQVGDVVSINGTKGTIEEIGVRCTKMCVSENNILIINNHEIGNIVNMSKRPSLFTLDIRVPSERPLLPLEEILNRELPLLGEKCPEIVGSPYLMGVTGLTNEDVCEQPAYRLTIAARYEEKDNQTVKLFLNREVKLLFEREGISLL